MQRRIRLLCVLALVAGGGCGSGTDANGDAAPDAALAVDVAGDVGEAAPAEVQSGSDDRRPAPDFELPDLEGNLVRLSSLRGKTVIVDFWATWCPPCLFQIPILNTIQAKHGPNGVEVIGIAVDAEGAEVVAPYAEENGIEYTIVIGDDSLARKFGAPGFPALMVVTPDGLIDSDHVGLIEEPDLEKAIASAQGGQG